MRCVRLITLGASLAEKHGRDSAEVSALILVTHLGAVLYLPPLLGVPLG